MRRMLFAAARRIAVMVGVVAIWYATAATIVAPPPVDAAMVERTVAGAEWLAARAKEAGERVAPAAGTVDLIDWLLAAGGAGNESHAALAAYLAQVGYSDPQFAVQVWLEEFSNVLMADQAARRSADLRSVSEIQAEIDTLPSVPLDDAGAAERARLRARLTLATTPASARQAAAAASARLDFLRRLAGLGEDQ